MRHYIIILLLYPLFQLAAQTCNISGNLSGTINGEDIKIILASTHRNEKPLASSNIVGNKFDMEAAVVPDEPADHDEGGRGSVSGLLLRRHVQNQHPKAAPQSVHISASLTVHWAGIRVFWTFSAQDSLF